MKIRAKLIAAVCGALLLEGVVSFLAVYLGLGTVNTGSLDYLKRHGAFDVLLHVEEYCRSSDRDCI